ncbi:hypothetical protein BC834DRAFT_503175 [Gloeopeniophorella convolvens]|nr:hypothetical protein BC834DRAFT_503175 [Gloeopeniophorella convolvens]
MAEHIEMGATGQNVPGKVRPETNFTDGSGAIFSFFLERAEKDDDKMTESWKGDADGILVFTGLFSATVATFLGISLQSLTQNSQDTSAFYLARLYQLSTPDNGNASTPSLHSPTPHPSRRPCLRYGSGRDDIFDSPGRLMFPTSAHASATTSRKAWTNFTSHRSSRRYPVYFMLRFSYSSPVSLSSSSESTALSSRRSFPASLHPLACICLLAQSPSFATTVPSTPRSPLCCGSAMLGYSEWYSVFSPTFTSYPCRHGHGPRRVY